jgi:hypothetical protein
MGLRPVAQRSSRPVGREIATRRWEHSPALIDKRAGGEHRLRRRSRRSDRGVRGRRNRSAAGAAPRLRGVLLTGDDTGFLEAELVADASSSSTVSDVCRWDPPTKLVARHLAPYLYGRDRPTVPA